MVGIPSVPINPRYIPLVVKYMETSPEEEMPIIPPLPPLGFTTSSMVSHKAVCKLPPLYLNRIATSYAATAFINASPCPVQEIAQELLAQVPDPIKGESPTRPYFLLVNPPVEVAAAKFP